MTLKQKLVVVGLGLIALAPAAAQADQPDGTSLFNTKGVVADYANKSTFTFDDPAKQNAKESFFGRNPCLVPAAAQMRKQIVGIAQTPAYLNAFKNYATQCKGVGASEQANPPFMIFFDFMSGVSVPGKPTASVAKVMFTLVDSGRGTEPAFDGVHISKQNPQNTGVMYAVPMGTPINSCTNPSTAVSDINVSAISSQMISYLQARANTCAAHNGSQGDQIDQLLGITPSSAQHASARQAAAGNTAAPVANSSDEVVQQKCWGACTSSAGRLH